MVFRYGVIEYYASGFRVSDYKGIAVKRNSFICCCGIGRCLKEYYVTVNRSYINNCVCADFSVNFNRLVFIGFSVSSILID